MNCPPFHSWPCVHCSFLHCAGSFLGFVAAPVCGDALSVRWTFGVASAVVRGALVPVAGSFCGSVATSCGWCVFFHCVCIRDSWFVICDFINVHVCMVWMCECVNVWMCGFCWRMCVCKCMCRSVPVCACVWVGGCRCVQVCAGVGSLALGNWEIGFCFCLCVILRCLYMFSRWFGSCWFVFCSLWMFLAG